MMKSADQNANLVPATLQRMLDGLTPQLLNRKDEVVSLLNDEQPTKSRLVDLSYNQCAWWEGCYYCQDEHGQWERVKCFI